jgi:hypothetical protein
MDEHRLDAMSCDGVVDEFARIFDTKGFGLRAIVQLGGRPAILIQDGDVADRRRSGPG